MSKSRGVVILYEDLTEHWVEWAKEAKLTNIGIHKIAPSGQHGFLQELLNQLDALKGRKILNMLESAGIQIEYELHSLEWLLPRNLIDKDKELFRENDKGERRNDSNFCPSNPNAKEIISENAYKLAKQLKQSGHNYFLWPDDAANAACHCEKCRANGYGGAELGMIFSNAVAEGIRAYDSKAMEAYIAYADAKVMPKIMPKDNVFLEFAPMDRDHTKPMNDPSEERGAAYIRLLKDLLEIFPAGTTHILEYWMDNAMFSDCKKPPVKLPFYKDVAESDVAMYTSFGVKHIKTFASYLDDEYYNLYGNPPMKEYGDILYKYIK